ncbi:MAG TPA: DUF488 domain-containing protein [Candidatus Eremiobacteraceae bacterium]|nr:DUF488 domain-containing protein [Candidatus Eremiobacteraceae bacterium]
MMTIGHGTHSSDALIELLQRNGMRVLVDVRAFPRSRHNPQFDRATVAKSLEATGIAYRWAQALGGRRTSTGPSPNVALRHPAFRAYADYMLTAEFRLALDDAMREDDGAHTAVMCSESVWWRCHRRLIADAVVLLRERPVAHIMPDGKVVAHRPTPGVRKNEDELIYDVESRSAD